MHAKFTIFVYSSKVFFWILFLFLMKQLTIPAKKKFFILFMCAAIAQLSLLVWFERPMIFVTECAFLMLVAHVPFGIIHPLTLSIVLALAAASNQSLVIAFLFNGISFGLFTVLRAFLVNSSLLWASSILILTIFYEFFLQKNAWTSPAIIAIIILLLWYINIRHKVGKTIA